MTHSKKTCNMGHGISVSAIMVAELTMSKGNGRWKEEE